MLAAMYHYVRPNVDRPPEGYYRLDRSSFRAQLDHFEREYRLVDRETFVAVVRGEADPPDDGLVLTFDDGLSDHHEWVLPELRSRGLWGVFFVPTGPFAGRTLTVHRVHALLGRLPAERVHEALVEVLDRHRIAATDGGGLDTYGSDDAAAAVKRLVNFDIPHDSAVAVLDAVEAELDVPTPTAEEFYLSERDLRELADAGMLVGAHTVTHPVLAAQPMSRQRAEVNDSFARLESVLGVPPVRLFAYPFGGPETFTAGTRRALAEVGCDAAFTTVSGSVDGKDVASRPLALPRCDCNEFPHGDASHDM